MERFDDIIIGAGPGGYEIAAELAASERKVALIEKDRPGGTCLNRGCIPTKCLCATAAMTLSLRDAAAFGIDAGNISVDYDAARQRMHGVVESLRSGVQTLLAKVETIHATAGILSDGTVEADGRRLSADRVLIATGSRPAILPVEGAEHALTSDDLLERDMPLPHRVTIIGGGVIGIEFANIFNALGSEVTVVEYCKEILPTFDTDISKRLRTTLQGRGVKFALGAEVTAISPDGCVHYRGKRGDASVEGDAVVMAVGRRPVLPEGLKEAGIELTPKGFIAVDEGIRTSRPGFYAAGDVTGLCMLAHAATAQARKAMLGEDVRLDIIPSAVFAVPEAAMVGLSAADCTSRGIECATARGNFAANGKALADGMPAGCVKIVYDPTTRKILGVHVLGPHASDLVAEGAALMYGGVTVDELAGSLVHSHPTLSEVLQSVARSAASHEA